MKDLLNWKANGIWTLSNDNACKCNLYEKCKNTAEMKKYETEQKRTKKKICKQQMHLFRNINTEKLKKSLQWAMSMLRIKIDTNECLA